MTKDLASLLQDAFMAVKKDLRVAIPNILADYPLTSTRLIVSATSLIFPGFCLA
jgi:hypothetical protein